jgi:hypothetical protein
MSASVVRVIAWLAVRAGAKVRPPPAADHSPGRSQYGKSAAARFAGAAPAVALIAEATTADRAGRLVPLAEEALEPEVSRSLVSHWALWAAVGLILLVLGAGYLRRRWRARGRMARGTLVEPGRRQDRD